MAEKIEHNIEESSLDTHPIPPESDYIDAVLDNYSIYNLKRVLPFIKDKYIRNRIKEDIHTEAQFNKTIKKLNKKRWVYN